MDLSLYAITDENLIGSMELERKVKEAIRGGATVIQYRAKKKSSRQMYLEAKKLREITKEYSVPLIVNDRLDIALSVGADGVHVGQNDLPVEEIRKIAGENFIVGLSTHNIDQVIEANEKDVDYIGFGPIFPTTTKENPEPVTGIGLLCKAVSISKVPAVAIGGIDENNVCDVVKCKPGGVAVVRAIFGKSDPYQAARKLKEKIKKCRRENESPVHSQ